MKENLKSKLVQVRLTPEDAEKVAEKAESQGLSVSQVIRLLLKEYISNPQGRLYLS